MIYIESKIEEFEEKFGWGIASLVNSNNKNPTSIRGFKQLSDFLRSALEGQKEVIRGKRSEVEKILWKAYEPDMSPNMEEVVDDILALLTEI